MTAEQALTESEVSQFFADWKLVSGVGDYKSKRACVMSAAVALTRVRRGVDMNGATDSLECVCPVVRRLMIARNDATTNDDERKAWAIPMIPRIVGTNEGRALSIRRAEHLARYAIRVIAADAMDSAKLPEIAAKCRSLGADAPMSDCRAVASEARDSANKERTAARWSAAAAAAAYAAYAAAAADADAAYAAYADAAAAYAAYAAADADAADAAYAAYAAYADAAAAAAAADADAYAAAAAAYAYAAAAAADADAYAAAAAADAAAAAAYAASAAARRIAVRLAHLDRMIEDVLAIKGSETSSNQEVSK